MAENRIIETITDNAVKIADDIINQSRKRAGKIIEEAKISFRVRKEQNVECAKKEAQKIVDATVPAGEIIVRNAVLKARREEIDKTINIIFDKVCSLPEEVYFSFIKKMIIKNKQAQKGMIIFNANDRKRMPSDFLNEFDDLSLDNENADISGGFILRYGKIYIDCAFEAIKVEKYDETVDLLNKELFA